MTDKVQLNSAALAAESLFPALCRELVVAPEAVRVDVQHGSASTAVVASAAPDDAGNLIGKGGRTVRSFRLLAQLVGSRHGWPVSYTVETPPGSNPPPVDRPELLAREWDGGAVARLLGPVLDSYLCLDADAGYTESGSVTNFEVVLHHDEPERGCELFVAVPELPASGTEPVLVQRRLQGDEAERFMLNVIFSAIGKVHGRKVHVAYVRRAPAAEPQPVSAAGRFAAELEVR